MNGIEIEKKYGITVLGFPVFDVECPKICLCGHHAKYHHGKGSAGYCEKCSPLRHKLTIKNWRMWFIGEIGSMDEQGLFAYAHNFTPKIQPSMPKARCK